MKCFFHESEDAVATCLNCGKSLCKVCAAKYNPCSCDECIELNQISIEEQRKQKKKDALIDTNAEFIGSIIKGLIAAVILTLIFNVMDGEPIPTFMSVMFFFVPFGWTVITYMEQWFPIFIMSGPIFLIYIVFKLVFSVVLGIPCFLFQVIKYIFKFTKTNLHFKNKH